MSNVSECPYAQSHEVAQMCVVKKGCDHGPAPIPEEGKWIQAKQITDISAYTHGVGWCAPQQGACKLSLNVKNGIIEEALVETIGCSAPFVHVVELRLVVYKNLNLLALSIESVAASSIYS